MNLCMYVYDVCMCMECVYAMYVYNVYNLCTYVYDVCMYVCMPTKYLYV